MPKTFEKTVLDNGLRVLTADMPQAKSVACFVMLAAGSRYETKDTNGIAHFAEHMFFKGTENRPTARDIAGEIDSIGGEFNAFTGKEYTGYYVKCAAEHRDTALDVLVDMLRHSKFDAEEIEREKGVIVEEMNMYYDTPRDYVDGVYDSLLYGDQPLGWDIIGTKETVRGATRETFTDYLDRWYRAPAWSPGSRRGGRRRRRAGRLAARRRRADGATGAADPVSWEQGEPRVKLHTKTSDQAHIRMGVHSYPLGHADRYPLMLLATVLAAACRHGSSRRCASAAASPTTSTATTRPTRTRGRSSPRAASTSSGSTRPSRPSSASSAASPRAGGRRRAREGTELRQGPPRALPGGPEGHDLLSFGSGTRCSRASASRRRYSPPSTASRSTTSTGSRRTSFARTSSTRPGPFDDPDRFEPLLDLSVPEAGCSDAPCPRRAAATARARRGSP